MSLYERLPALWAPAASRASRWVDTDVANTITTDVLRRNETRLFAAAARKESFVEFRGPAPAGSGKLMVLAAEDDHDGAVLRPEVSSAVVRMDLSGSAPVILESYPENLDVASDEWDLLQLLTRLTTSASEFWIDPGYALEHALAADPSRAAAAAAQLRSAVPRGDLTAADALLRRLTGSALRAVDGMSRQAWWTSVEELLDATAAGGRPPFAGGASTPGREPVRQVRSGMFEEEFEGDALAALVTEALDRGSDQFDAWGSDDEGPTRGVLHVDMGRTVGTVQHLIPELAVATTQLAVVVQADPDADDGWFVLDAGPEAGVDATARERFPDLAHCLGGFLGPSLERVDILAWPGQHAMLAEHWPVTRVRLAAEIDELLALPGPLSPRLAALGCALGPVDAVGWLRRMRHRATTLPWYGDAGADEGPDDDGR